MSFTDFIIPSVFLFILIYALIKRVPAFDSFTDGAAEGLRTSVRMIPSLICMLTCVGMLRSSGAIDALCRLIGPFTEKAGLPADLLPLALIRPLSGSGSLSVCREILEKHGPDSSAGILASVLQSAGETTFYTLSLYYGSTGISKTRYTIAASLIGDIACIIAACWAVKLLYR